MKLHCNLAKVVEFGLFILLTFVLCAGAQGQTFTVLHAFTGQLDGGNPLGTPTLGADGNFYGTTYYASATQRGTAYKLALVGGDWTVSTLYTFGTGGQTDGQNPYGNLLFSGGILYGVAWEGGASVLSLACVPHRMQIPFALCLPCGPPGCTTFKAVMANIHFLAI
jgi:hypothetical protein